MKNKTYDIPTIHVTDQYDIFNRLEGNRPVTKKRSSKIRKSIEARGYIPVPIVVNEHLEIIDGQGRVDAVSNMGLPVYYMIVPGLGLEDCVQMNITSTSWTLQDYVSSYANTGNENYQRLIMLQDNHRKLPLSVIVCAATGVMASNNANIKTGLLELPQDRCEDIDEMLSYVELFVPICKEHTIGNANQIYMALCFCYQCDQVNNDRMLNAFARYTHKARSTSSIAEILNFLTEMYNCNLKKDRVYITTEYYKYMDGMYAWYANKWGHKTLSAGESEIA